MPVAAPAAVPTVVASPRQRSSASVSLSQVSAASFGLGPSPSVTTSPPPLAMCRHQSNWAGARSVSGSSVVRGAGDTSAKSSRAGSTVGVGMGEGSPRRRRKAAPANARGPRRRPRQPTRGVAFTGRRAPQDVVHGTSVLYCQAVLLCLFLGLVRYDESDDIDKEDQRLLNKLFQDVHVMIFVGFGFLMMFLRKYGYSSVGFTLMIGALMIQWAALCQGFFNLQSDGKIYLSMVSLFNADVATAAILISFGAVLGKTTPLQLVAMGSVEMVFFAVNEHVCHKLHIVDLGGSIIVHVFGAYFGLAVSRALGRPGDNSNESSSYTSDMFAMIGTVFLWLFWPSFNGGLASGHARHRAVINTYLALASGCVVAYAVSSLSQRAGKFNMVHVQNATLAGGVAMGTAADLMVQPVGALIIGGLAGALSVLGYAFLQPVILNRLKVHDTCGVHNLHGMPGVMAAIVSAVMAGIASERDYSWRLYEQFPAMAPRGDEPDDKLDTVRSYLGPAFEPGLGRTPLQQAGYQLAALAVTLVVSLVTGTVTGFLLRQDKLLPQLGKEGLFEDAPHWDVPDEECGATESAPPVAPPSAVTLAPLSVGAARKLSASSLEARNNIPALSTEVERDQVPRDETHKW
ncbi:Ammonium transporter Rh type B-A [Frankliniella fusca]|uniref:Ammonium transporter Rh type B-A n=1 Tax=Frankliniella fusca TaxID=407009 RepID=A0AAE1H0G8_9NEOP|nr:Ammonium transporter Rh type B-A [Frankliniella fusca]